MPLNLPDKLPAIELLKEENIFVIDNSRATQQDIRPLRIVILNLMPLRLPRRQILCVCSPIHRFKWKSRS